MSNLKKGLKKLKAEGLKKGSKKKFPDLSGDGKVTMKDVLIGRGVIKAGRGSAILKKIGLSGLKKDKSKISRSQIIKAAKKAKKTEDRVPATKSAFVPATEPAKKFRSITKSYPGVMKDLPLIKGMSRKQRQVEKDLLLKDLSPELKKLLKMKQNRKLKRASKTIEPKEVLGVGAVTAAILDEKKNKKNKKKVKGKAQGGSIKSFSANLKDVLTVQDVEEMKKALQRRRLGQPGKNEDRLTKQDLIELRKLTGRMSKAQGGSVKGKDKYGEYTSKLIKKGKDFNLEERTYTKGKKSAKMRTLTPSRLFDSTGELRQKLGREDKTSQADIIGKAQGGMVTKGQGAAIKGTKFKGTF